MQKCPKCNHFSVEYNSHAGAYMCTVDGCSCIVYDKKSYSYLKPEPLNKTVSRVKVVEGHEAEVIKRYVIA